MALNLDSFDTPFPNTVKTEPTDMLNATKASSKDMSDRDWFNDVKYPEALLGRKRCRCDQCTRVRKAAWQVDDLPCMQDNEISKAISDMQKAIWKVRDLLHRRHRPELYDSEDRVGRNKEEEMGDEAYYELETHQGPDIERVSVWPSGGFAGRSVEVKTPDAWSEAKFMVCDHCMAHNLPCDENSLCEQCQLHEIPCIHRWCLISPDTRAECTKPNCHSAHRDHFPCTDSNLARVPYVICPGRLPELLSRETMEAKGSNLPRENWQQHREEMRELQKTGAESLTRQALWGGRTWNEVRAPCGRACSEEYERVEDWTGEASLALLARSLR